MVRCRGLESPRRSQFLVRAVTLGGAALTLLSFSHGAGAQDAVPPKVSREQALQASLTKHAIVAAERRGELHLRDLNLHCGVPEPDVAKLREALSQAITAWVEAHPPQQYQYPPYEADFSAILKSSAWTDALQKVVSPKAQRAFGDLREARRQRLAAGIAGFVRAFVACELRLTPDQYAALVPLCNEIGEDGVEFDVMYTAPCQLVKARDRGAVRVLSEVQSEYSGRPGTDYWDGYYVGPRRGRDAVTEFELESERLRLVCALDDGRAHLLRACGRDQGRKQIAAQQVAAAEAAKKIEDAKKAGNAEDAKKAEDAKTAEDKKININNGLPREEVLAAPFWVKVRDSVLTTEERARLAAAPPIDATAVRAARVELALARLESLFHLDAKQLDSLRPLAEKVADEDLGSPRIASLDVLRGFGMRIDWRETTPEQRAARRGLETLLDPQQFEVLRDRTGM